MQNCGGLSRYVMSSGHVITMYRHSCVGVCMWIRLRWSVYGRARVHAGKYKDDP